MIAIDRAAATESGKNLIEIRSADRNYEPIFFLEDGQKLSVTWPSGHLQNEVCRYIDPHHFYFGGFCFHIDQFAEGMARNRCSLQPENYITDLTLYRKFYADRDLMDENGKRIPYRALVDLEFERGFPTPTKVLAICPQATLDRQVAYLDRSDPTSVKTEFYSMDQALSQLIPRLELPAHEWKLICAVFEEHKRDVPHISQQDFDAIPKDYKGVYSDYEGKHPNWKGKRTAFLPGHGTTLFIEDVSFVIDPGKKPSLSAQVSAAADKCEASHKQNHRTAPQQER